jgi:hypothetical protein
MIESPGAGRVRPKTVPGKSSVDWMAQMFSCSEGGKEASRIAHCDPADRNRGVRRQRRIDVDHGVDPDFRPSPDARTIVGLGSGRDEYVLF